MAISTKDIIRFWSKVKIGSDDECWLWQSHIKPNGYGGFWLRNMDYNAPRIAYCIANTTDLPEIKGLFVLHSCDVRPCVNPKHLRLGTPQENIKDREERKRHPHADKGENSSRAKLKMKDIQEICRLRKIGFTQQSIAIAFGVTQSQVSRIVYGKNWAHLAKSTECVKVLE
jgi:predicted XRE-type DNA-binding protein